MADNSPFTSSERDKFLSAITANGGVVMGNRWREQSSEALVEAALEHPFPAVIIGDELARRGPDEAGARRVCDAYREGRFRKPWEAALLLRCLRHPVGYETVREMFADESLTDSYGNIGSALATIDSVRAAPDLCSLVVNAPTQAAREEAALGLATLPSTAGCLALADAAGSSRVGRNLAGKLLVDLGVTPAVVEEWFASGDRAKAEVACEVVVNGAGRPRGSDEAPCNWSTRERRHLLALAHRAMASGQADPRPYARTWLRRGKKRHSSIWLLATAPRRAARFVMSRLGIGDAPRA